MSERKIDIGHEDLKALLEYALKETYKSKENDIKGEQICFNCLRLFGKDYKYSVVPNRNGELCANYPSKIPILEYAIPDGNSKHGHIQSLYSESELKELFSKARFARCRSRFAVPVILYEGKHILRSATISGGAEMYGRSSFDFLFGGEKTGERIPANSREQPREQQYQPSSNENSQLHDRIRGQDISLLKKFSVNYICDFMVEKKKVKFGMNITSSEKVDKNNRYADFVILSIPYPGCEFFKDWRDNGFRAEGLLFDWSQGYVDALLDLPGPPPPPKDMDWTQYKSWDLVQLTQNYLKLLLHYVREGTGGLLVHCISGWDRTPLYISLIRLSLWADGAIHTTLGPLDILYLTIAYDWFLFGHHFPDRLSKGEEIFFFCFNFLKYITSDEYSIYTRRVRRGSSRASRTDSECAIDGVLLDAELIPRSSSIRGSNNSINSMTSLNSSVDNAPIYFTAGSVQEDDAFTFSVGSNGGAYSKVQYKPSPDSDSSNNGRHPSIVMSTSPVAVPRSVRRMSEARNNSSACGSWQMITGTGSVRGSGHYLHDYDSPQSSGSGGSASNNANYGPIPEADPDVGYETVRKQRLDAVRRLFLQTYTTLTGTRSSPNAGSSGGLSGLVQNFAEKVGFKGPPRTNSNF